MNAFMAAIGSCDLVFVRVLHLRVHPDFQRLHFYLKCLGFFSTAKFRRKAGVRGDGGRGKR